MVGSSCVGKRNSKDEANGSGYPFNFSAPFQHFSVNEKSTDSKPKINRQSLTPPHSPFFSYQLIYQPPQPPPKFHILYKNDRSKASKQQYALYPFALSMYVLRP